MELTEEQKKQLKVIKKQFYIKASAVATLYILWLFASNLFTIIINSLYMHSKSFVFLNTLGITVIILTGLHGTISELHLETEKQIKKALDSESKE